MTTPHRLARPHAFCVRRIADLMVLVLLTSLLQAFGPLLPGLGPGSAQAAVAAQAASGQYYSVWVRAASALQLAAGATQYIRVTGIGGVPEASQVSAVALNLAARGVGGAGGLVVYTEGQVLPSTTAFSYRNGVYDDNLMMIKTWTNGWVIIHNRGSVTAVLYVDVHGYVAATPQPVAGGRTVTTAQTRIVNGVSVAAGSAYTLAPLGTAGVPATGVSHVLFTLTARSATSGYFIVHPTGTARPVGANLHYGGDIYTRNLVIAQLDADGRALIFNGGAAPANAWVDVVGYMLAPGSTRKGDRIQTVLPARIASSVSVPAQSSITLGPLGSGGVPTTGVTGVGLNVSVRSAGSGSIRAYQSGTSLPAVTGVTFQPNLTSTGFVVAALGGDGRIVLHNSASAAATVWVDAHAYLEPASLPTPPRAVQASGGDSTATVTWQPASDGGDPITQYSVTAFPGGATTTVAGDVTTAVVTGLTNGAEYSFTVRARNALGWSGRSAPSEPVTTEASRPPGAPLITDVYPRDSAVRVSWSPPDTGAENLVRYVVTASPGGTSVEAPATATEAIVTGLTNGTRYTFTLAAVAANGSGVSLPSPAVAPEPARVPQRPPITHAIALSQRIDVQWAAPVDGGALITGYTVAAQPGNHTLQIPATTTVASLTGLVNGTTYSVSVTAVNKAGASQPSTRDGVTPVAARVPSPPTDVQTAARGNGHVGVGWTVPIDTGTGPVTEYQIVASPGGRSQTVPATSTYFIMIGFDPAVRYSFTVQARNAVGLSVPSAPTEPVLPKLTIKRTPKVLSAAEMATLRRVHPDGTLDFEQPPASLSGALVTGDLLIADIGPLTPRGLYRKVTAINSQSGLFVVSTAPAALTEALGEGAFAFNAAIDTADVAAFAPLSPGVRLSRPMIGGNVAPAAATADGSDLEVRDGSLIVTIEEDIPLANGDNSGQFEVTLTVTPEADVSAGLSLSGDVTTRSEFGLTYEVEARAQLGPLTWSKEWPIATVRDKCFTVYIGAVPLHLCLELEIKIKLEVTAGGGLSIDVAYGREVGVEIRTQNTSVSVDRIDRELPHDRPQIQAFGVFGARVSLPIQAALYLYDLIGPGFKAEPWVNGTLDTRADPCWSITVGLKVDAFFRSREILGHQIDWTADGVIDISRPVADSGGPCRGIRVVPEVATVAPGQAVQFLVEYLGNVPATSISWRIVAGPGTIDQTGRYLHNAPAAAVVEASRPAEGVIHPEYKARASVLVGTPPPGPPTINSVTPGPFSAAVAFSPPPLPPGQTITRFAVVTDPPTRTTYVTGDQTTARVTHLVPGDRYLVRVYAISGTVMGSPSDWAGPVIPADALGRIGSSTDLAVDAAGNPDNRGFAGTRPAAISGNGRYLFFYTRDDSNLAPEGCGFGPGSGYCLVRKDLRTGEMVLASRGPDGTALGGVDAFARPAPNADGSKVALSARPPDMPTAIYVRDLLAGMTRIVQSAVLPNQVGAPSISDDGSVIAYRQQDAGTSLIHIYRSSGGQTAQRVDSCFFGSGCDVQSGVEMHYSMTADGSKIIYTDEPPDGSSHVLLYDATAGTTRDLTAPQLSTDDYYDPVISPDGMMWAAWRNSIELKGVVRKRIDAGPPTGADMVRNNPQGAGGQAYAFNRDGSILTFNWWPGLIGNPKGYVYGPDRDELVPQASGSWTDRNMDISYDGTIVIWNRRCADNSCGTLQGGRLG